ncbi:hypothetical protein HY632_02485 [Candidatus Uhrbacteria bacterium]|nr:hypothetical protein [Candidatus Uhrbacteria bacterium]
MVHHPRHVAGGIAAVVVAVGLAAAWVWRSPQQGEVRPAVVMPALNVPTSVPREVAPVFFDVRAMRNVQDLTVDDLPSVGAGIRRVAPYQDGFFIATDRTSTNEHVRVHWYDGAGRLRGQLHPRTFADCEIHDIAVVGDSLFLACLEVGIVEVDLVQQQIGRRYGTAEGIPDLRNLNLAVDGDVLWVGTFNGVARIDTTTHVVHGYREQLGIAGAPTTAMMHVRNGEVWVQIPAHAASAGGVARYDATRDRWIAYGPDAFGKRDPSRIDFEEFIVSDRGVFAVYQDEGPDRVVLATLYERDGRWIVLATGKYADGSRARMLRTHLPPRESYADTDVQVSSKTSLPTAVRLLREGKWVTIRPTPDFRQYYVVIPGTATDAALAFSSQGIEEISGSAYPKLLAAIPGRATGSDSSIRLVISPDRRYLAVDVTEAQAIDGTVTEKVLAMYDRVSGALAHRRVQPTIDSRTGRYTADIAAWVNGDGHCPQDRTGISVTDAGWLEAVFPGKDAYDVSCFRVEIPRYVIRPWQ